MSQKDNILQELNELQSSLVNAVPGNLYQVPAGYFDSLAEKVLNRVRALETGNAGEELNDLSPLLSSISKKTPYSVPVGFFDELDGRIAALITHEEQQTASEEIEELSPLLSGLKKEMPYTVPQGYFENINPAVPEKTKVISITRQKWFRYAAAAVIVGFVATAGFLVFNKPSSIDPNKQSFAWVEKNLKKVSTDDINSFVELADKENTSIAKADIKESDEIKELIKDIPEKDIQSFLDETGAVESENAGDDLLLN